MSNYFVTNLMKSFNDFLDLSHDIGGVKVNMPDSLPILYELPYD